MKNWSVESIAYSLESGVIVVFNQHFTSNTCSNSTCTRLAKSQFVTLVMYEKYLNIDLIINI